MVAGGGCEGDVLDMTIAVQPVLALQREVLESQLDGSTTSSSSASSSSSACWYNTLLSIKGTVLMMKVDIDAALSKRRR
jgi:hypothetical protein